MKHPRMLLTLALVSISFLFHSCSTTNLNKLEGEWELCWINNLSDQNIYLWRFEAGELRILVYDPTSPLPQPILGGVAKYKTSVEFLDAVVEIYDFEQSISHSMVIPQISNGKWTIDKISNDYMRLATSDQEASNGSYVIREFYSVDSGESCRIL